MLHTTRAIVLHKTNYSESSIVVQLYTLHYGRISILVQGAKKKRAKNKIALFEPLSNIEITGKFSKSDKLIRPNEIKNHIPLIDIQIDISKRLIALFLAEVIHKGIKESIPEPEMYLFIEKSLYHLEITGNNVANFHLVFLLEWSKYLGMYPSRINAKYFNLTDGVFTNQIPGSGVYIQGEEKNTLYALLGMKIDNSHELKLTSEQRRIALNTILDYYRIHISGMGEIKSHYILETIF